MQHSAISKFQRPRFDVRIKPHNWIFFSLEFKFKLEFIWIWFGMRFLNPVTDDLEYSLKFTCCFRPKKMHLIYCGFAHAHNALCSLSFRLSLFVSWIPFLKFKLKMFVAFCPHTHRCHCYVLLMPLIVSSMWTGSRNGKRWVVQFLWIIVTSLHRFHRYVFEFYLVCILAVKDQWSFSFRFGWFFRVHPNGRCNYLKFIRLSSFYASLRLAHHQHHRRKVYKHFCMWNFWPEISVLITYSVYATTGFTNCTLIWLAKKTHVSPNAIEKWIGKTGTFYCLRYILECLSLRTTKRNVIIFLLLHCLLNALWMWMPNRSSCVDTSVYVKKCQLLGRLLRCSTFFLCLSHLNFFKRPKVFFVSCWPYFFSVVRSQYSICRII